MYSNPSLIAMKRIATIISAAALAMPMAIAAPKTIDSSYIKLHDLSVEVDEQKGNMHVSIDIDPSQYKVGRERELILVPVLVSDNRADSLEMKEIIIAGRNRWLQYQRADMLDNPGSNIFRAGKKGHAKVEEDVRFEPWMADSHLELRVMSANCCDSPSLLAGTSPSGNVGIVDIALERPQLVADYIYASPVDAGPVVKNIEGSAFVTFSINNTVLKENYMKNRPELNKIIRSIEFVRKDPDAKITSVHIKGFASPEGPYENNVRLAQGRTESLRRYVRDLYSFSDSTVTSSYEAENWTGLRSYVADSLNINLTNRAAILEIIDGPSGYDEKNDAIMRRFPTDYDVLLKEVYPWLRRSDYKVTYEIKEYTTLDEIRKVFAEDPSRLRNVDFYTLASAYPVGSREYCEVYDAAMEVYPNDPELNLNAAYIELDRGNLAKAQTYLYNAGETPQANYGLGILAARRGNYAEALNRFSMAKAGGVKEAADAIKRVEAIRDYTPVTYLVEIQDSSK